MGHNIIVLCNIRLKQHTHDLIQQFMDTVQTIDQITECYNTTGDYDFQIKVYARDMKAYQDFMLNTLGNIDCIGSLHSIIVIGEIKDFALYSRQQNKEVCDDSKKIIDDMPVSFRHFLPSIQGAAARRNRQSSNRIRKLGAAHFFSIFHIPDDTFRLMQGKTPNKNCTVGKIVNCDI